MRRRLFRRKKRAARRGINLLARRRATRLLLAVLSALGFALVAWSSPARSQESASASVTLSTADRLNHARELTAEKRFDEAADVLRGIVAAEPRNEEALSLLARVLAWSRHFDESIATYGKLLEVAPANATHRAGYARVLAWSGRYEASIREFRRAIAADSTNLETRVGYARALSWAGDLAGASIEYRSIVAADSSYGGAWLGLATVARWRGAATASDRFAARAAGPRGADPGDLREERAATWSQLRPEIGGGWGIAREIQYVSGDTPFELETSGPFAYASVTPGRAVNVRARAARQQLWERPSTDPAASTQNYDLHASVFAADVSLLRTYPVQASVGATYEMLEQRSANVRYPLGGADDFFGPRARVWSYWGRLTPSVSISRDFYPRKLITADTLQDVRRLEPGGVTNTTLAVGWQPGARWLADVAMSGGFYSDGNERAGARAGGVYRARLARPRIALDYTWAWTDFQFASGNYFTPLQSVKHTAGISFSGWADNPTLDWGVRYQISPILSSNFPDIVVNSWIGSFNVNPGGRLPLGVEGWYSVDNNDYQTWGVSVSAGIRP